MFPFLQLFDRFKKQFATRAFADKQPPLPAATSGTALVHVRQRTGSSIRDCASSWRQQQ
jgi:hypothetical protein